MDGFQIINLRLLSHPFNWAFVWITLALAALAYNVIFDHYMQTANNSIAPD